MHAKKEVLRLAAVVLLVAGAARAEEPLVSPEVANTPLAQAVD